MQCCLPNELRHSTFWTRAYQSVTGREIFLLARSPTCWSACSISDVEALLYVHFYAVIALYKKTGNKCDQRAVWELSLGENSASRDQQMSRTTHLKWCHAFLKYLMNQIFKRRWSVNEHYPFAQEIPHAQTWLPEGSVSRGNKHLKAKRTKFIRAHRCVESILKVGNSQTPLGLPSRKK